MIPMKVSLALASGLLLGACAAPPMRIPAEPPAWVAASTCAATLADVPATAVNPTRETMWRAEFRNAAACLGGPETAEPVILFALSRDQPLSELDIRLHIGRDYLLGAGVKVLDAEFRPLQNHGFDGFTQRSGHFSRRLFLAQDGEAAAYLLVRIDPVASGSQLDLITGQRVAGVWMAAGYMGSVADGTEARRQVAIRDTGVLSLHRP